MWFLPIMQELFESDSIWFFAVWMVVTAIITLRAGSRKKAAVGTGVMLAIWAACEICAYWHRNYLWDLVVLLLGTLALGGCVGCLSGLILMLLWKKKQ